MNAFSILSHARNTQIATLTKNLDQRRLSRAELLDKAADAEMNAGRIQIAERLSRHAADLREAMQDRFSSGIVEAFQASHPEVQL